jgi:tetrapyrrole methylase family protein/MazG family protein
MPPGITIIGLGPGRPGLLTIEAQHALARADELYLRTRRHPTVEALPPSVVIHSFDDIYERAGTFEQVYDEIASRILELGRRTQGVVYAVPGHPLVGEASVQRILTQAEAEGLPVRIVEGLSFVEPVCTRLHLDPLDGLQLADAMTLAMQHYPGVNPDLPLLISQLYNREVAADVKLTLMVVYPDDHPVTLIRAAGTEDEALRSMPLYELDRAAGIDHLTSLYVPPLAEPGSLPAFQGIVAQLRAPNGCPWDREQTHRSLRPFLLEETYEVLEALDADDSAGLREELGDLLLQILLHTQIAIEDDEFRMADVIAHIVAKLKRRHPHVFGKVQVANSQEVVVNWERIKGEEKNHQPKESILEGIPVALPALARAQSLQRRVERLGFDWADIQRVWGKVEEEWHELRAAAPGEEQAHEVGDALFALVSLARWLGIDAESSLRNATERFARRFQSVQQECARRGDDLTQLDTAQLEALWSQAKTKNG